MDKYTFGKNVESWRGGIAQTVTFIVTDDCNLRCKYCYITSKNCDTRMDISVAKKFIDKLLSSDEISYQDAVILDFIGGEPMLEAKLIDEIIDYFKKTAFLLDHKWYWNYRISICTNGVNYDSEEVQKLIKKNKDKMSMTISVDGVKEKHDMQRVFADGSGSFDKINSNIDLWMSQFVGSTKITFASDDLPLLYDSILYLWERGIKQVNSNVVFEDVWKENDDQLLEQQLKKLADYVIENELFNKGYYCSFFSDSIGMPYTEIDLDNTYCGAGKMIALSPKGDLYPCLRYYGHSLNNHKDWTIGDIETGVDMERVRPFMLSTTRLQSDSECLDCNVATGCGFCQGYNYDESQTGTNFYRVKYICKMHKARVRANDYFFSKLYNIYGINKSFGDYDHKRKSIYFLLDDSFTTYCCYNNKNDKKNQEMDLETIREGLDYTRQNGFAPIFVHSKNNTMISMAQLLEYDIVNLVPYGRIEEAKEKKLKRIIPIFEVSDINEINDIFDHVILNIESQNIGLLADSVSKLYKNTNRINLNITDLDKQFNQDTYELQLKEIGEYIEDCWKTRGVQLEINILTDNFFSSKHENCGAGEHSFVIDPIGRIYACCAGIEVEDDKCIGNIKDGINKHHDNHLYKVNYSNLCRECDAYQCKNCIDINKKFTNEINVSPSFQCIKSNIEKQMSKSLGKRLNWIRRDLENKTENQTHKLDPMRYFLDKNKAVAGYYNQA